ncbi:energy-coupling factor transporter transmembrane component T family protein [Paenibacillus sp. FA6]|uniref:energy-coupling factor transporter transmembrane component T family protein n=1 Tax=Paenibacillus sp. FA6 TaxID=3413029 RepID=UPI003F658D9B
MIIPYVQGQSGLYRIDPLSKLVLVLCIAILSMIFQTSTEQVCLLLFSMVTARFVAGITWRGQWKALSFLIVFTLPLFIITVFTTAGDNLLIEFGMISITSEALDMAGSVSLRMFTVFLTSYVYVKTTDPQDLVASLTRILRIPYRFAFGISMALTFLPLLQEEGRSISAAHQIRGRSKGRGWADTWSWWITFTSAVLYNAVRRVQQTAAAMESKGFGAYPDRTYLRPLMPWGKGRVLAIAGILMTIGLGWVF